MIFSLFHLHDTSPSSPNEKSPPLPHPTATAPTFMDEDAPAPATLVPAAPAVLRER
jgi:hypothetical protein